MPNFRYQVLNATGKKDTGILTAGDSTLAASSLRNNGFLILELKETKEALQTQTADDAYKAKGNILTRFIGEFKPVLTNDLIFFFQQMSLMLRAGLPIIEALEITRDQCRKPRLGRVLFRIVKAIKTGESLSGALEKEKIWFPDFAIKLVYTAEATGEMGIIFDRISKQMRKSQELKTNLMTSLIYPSIVILVSIGVSAFLVLKVIPKFSKFLQNNNKGLPKSTQLLMDISSWMQNNVFMILIGMGSFFTFLIILYLTRKGRVFLDRNALRIPVFGKLLSIGLMAGFTQTLSILLKSGMTLLGSLRILKSNVKNKALAKHLEKTFDDIHAGQGFSKSFENTMIPGLVTELIAVGEKTGSLDITLEELSGFYEKSLDQSLKRMTALFEPVMILFVGGIVGFVYFAFFQAMFKMAGAKDETTEFNNEEIIK